MSKKTIGISILVIGFILIILIGYFLFFYDFSKTNEPAKENTKETVKTENVNSLPTGNTSVINTNNQPSVKTPATKMNEEDLKRIASAFAERFGSFSNQSNYGNIRDLMIFMTKKMQTWANNFIAEETKKEMADIYYGVTTKAISSEVKEFNDDSGTAQILVSTQKRESTGTSSNTTVTYKSILISFVKENNSWKVDSAVWQ